jgi:CRISPR-associated protein Cas2
MAPTSRTPRSRRSNDEHAYVVAYDIADKRRWRRVFKLMHGYGRWLQLSIFHCRLDGGRRADLALALERLIARDEDHVVILDLGPAEEVEVAVESLGKTFQPIERRAVVV